MLSCSYMKHFLEFFLLSIYRTNKKENQQAEQFAY